MIKLRRFEGGRWCDVFVCASSVRAVVSGDQYGADVLVGDDRGWIRGVSETPQAVNAMIAEELRAK